MLYEDADKDQDLGKAELALKEAEEKFGPEDERVSYALDHFARLLRQAGTRTLDAANMEARARAIRVKRNSMETFKDPQAMQDISDAIKWANQRRRQEKTRKTIVFSAATVIVLAVIAKLVLMPSESERTAVNEAMKTAEQFMPTTIVQNMVQKGKDVADIAKAAHEQHNKQLEKYMGD
jgi:hypothetical protein